MTRIKILLAEDDLDDQSIFLDTLKDRGDVDLLPIVENGEDLFNYLDNRDNSAVLPDAIILDQNMPKLNGIQTLALLKQNSRLAHIPVMIYSTYADENLRQRSATLGAAIVMSKPSTYHGYHHLIDKFFTIIHQAEQQ